MSQKKRQKSEQTLLESIARGESQTTSATLAGVSRSTVRRRLGDPEFRQQVEKFREEMLDATAGRLAASATKAVETLDGLLDADSPPAVRLAAARSVIEFSFKSREVLSWEKRLADLESSVKANQQYGNER